MGLWDIPAKHEICDTELRFNPYHDPTNGRFISGSGGASLGGYLYSKGGKSAYVLPSNSFRKNVDNSKHGGFSVTDMDGTKTNYITKSNSIYPVNSKYEDEVMTAAYQQFGSTQAVIDRINKIGKGKAAAVSDSDIEAIQSKYKSERQLIEKEKDRYLVGNKHSVNRHRAYWSAM